MNFQPSASVMILLLIFFAILFPSAAIISYLSRKYGADLQARVGPNRAGPAGIFQPIADFLKALQKEDAARAVPVSQQMALAAQSALLFSTVAILPLSSGLLLLDTDMSVFLALWAALAVSMISLVIGFRQGTMPAWIGAIRVAGQAVTGAFPAVLAILCVGVQTGSFRWTKILAAQGAGPFSWNIFSSPFAPFAFLVFVVAGLVLFSSAPMDAGVSRAELAGGLFSQWVGRNLLLMNFGRFYGSFLWSCMAVTCFLGGWLIPQAVQDALGGGAAVVVLETLTLLVKSFMLMLAVYTVARVNPRTRTDQITSFSWRIVSPIALMSLVGSALWRVWLS